MNINRKPLSFSSLSFRERKPAKLKRETSHRITAFDTETYKGTAKLICASDGTYILNPDALQMLEFMTSSRFRQAHVFAYNLRFDAQALLKLLPSKNIREISVEGSSLSRA